MKSKSVRVIFDTNVWISFLIGKRLSKIKRYIADRSIIIITTKQLIAEIRTVTTREKLKKYFPRESVEQLIDLLETIAENVDVLSKHSLERDPKDSFLLDLIDFSAADYLVTGDKDLLAINPFKNAQIVTPAEFEARLETQSEDI